MIWVVHVTGPGYDDYPLATADHGYALRYATALTDDPEHTGHSIDVIPVPTGEKDQERYRADI